MNTLLKLGTGEKLLKKMADGAEGLFDLFREVKEGFSEKVTTKLVSEEL